VCAANYGHKNEIVALAPCPTNAALVGTVYNAVTAFRGSVWKMPNLPAADAVTGEASNAPEPSAVDLELVADLPTAPASFGRLHTLAWGATGSSASSSSSSPILAVYGGGIRECVLREGGGASALSCTDVANGSGHGGGAGEASFVGGAAWDPHHPSECAVAADAAVHFWDIRAGERTRSIESAVPPGGCVRSLSYNPNKPYFVATGGDDHKVKCWDVRKAAAPVKVLEGHTHW
jgi:hypothetical protein